MKFLIIIVFVLVSCGGGGGGSSSSAQPLPAPIPPSSSSSTSSSSSSSSSSLSYRLTMNSLDISLSDNIAQLKLGEQTSSTNFFDRSKEFFKANFKMFVEILVPELLAQTNSLIPVDLSQWEIISKKLSGDSLVDINPEVRAYEANNSSYIFRSENNYICHYKLTQNSDNSGFSSSTFPFVNPSNDPFSGGSLYQLTDDQGNAVETFEVDGTTPVYSDEAQSCGFNEVVIQCDTSNLPIHIKKSIAADNSGSLFAEIEYAYKLQEFQSACTPQLETKKFFIKDKKIYPLGDRYVHALDGYQEDAKRTILKPNDLFNTTSEVVVVDKASSGDSLSISSYSIGDNDILKIKQLNPPNIEFSYSPGTIAYDGTYLFLKPLNDPEAPTFYKSNINEDGFSIIRPEIVENGEFYAESRIYNYGESNVGNYPAGTQYRDCSSGVAVAECAIYHLGVNWAKRGYAPDSDKAFQNNTSNTLRFVFDKEENLLIFSNGWAHSYNKSSDVISRVVTDFPPTVLKSLAQVKTHDLDYFASGPVDLISTPCPTSSSDSLSPNAREDFSPPIESCMSWPNVVPGNFSPAGIATNIIGRWENFIVFENNGAWDPSSLIYTGLISDLPIRPRDLSNSGLPSVGSFFDYVDGHIYFVNSDKNIYIKYDLRNHGFMRMNLDAAGYIADTFEVTKDYVYVQVVNSANSNVEYVRINFNEGNFTFLGTISEGQRSVLSIQPIGF